LITEFKILLVIGGIAFLAVPLRADPSAEETKALSAAEQSYREGAFDLCNDRIVALLKKYPKSELLAQAQLIQAQALYQLGRSDAALDVLNLPLQQVPPGLQSDTLFWQAESLLDLERWPEAEQKYRALLALKNTPERNDAANLGLAWALFKEERQADAMPLIQAVIKGNPNGLASQQAKLLLGKIELAQGQSKEAIASFASLLAAKPEAGLAFQTDYWLGEAYAAGGQYTQAVASYQNITGDISVQDGTAPVIQAFPKTLVAEAFLSLGRAEHELHQDDLAATAYQQAYQLTENIGVQIKAFQAYLESARLAGQLPEAVAKLQEFAKSSDAVAPAALLAIGTVLSEDGEDDRAIGILESLLVAYAKSPWIPAADYQLGLLYARTGKADQAAGAFQSCLATASDPALIRTARFELGDVLLNQTKDYAGAAAQFAQISVGTDTGAEGASYNFLLAQAYMNKTDAFMKAEVDFVKRFPQSSYMKKIGLAQGQLLARAGKTDDAKVAYQNAIAEAGGGPDQEALLEALADLQYQTGDLAGTVKTCQMLVTQFPDDSLLAAQREILVSYEMGKLNDDQAEQKLIALSQKYEKSPDAPEAYFRLGEFYFYRQDYVKAQDAFQQLTTAYPTSSYVDDAYFFAGRAAAAHTDYNAALALLQEVPDNSPFKIDAQLWEGRVYQQQLDFGRACTLANAVLATEKDGPNFVAANLLKGQCLYEMGTKTKDPAYYGQSVAAFNQILDSTAGTLSDRNEAAVKSAKSLEQMGEADKAMGLYLDVLYGHVHGDELVASQPSDSFWQIEAGWQAARIRQTQKDWRGAIEVYRRMEQIGGPQQQQFHDLVNKLRQDNYIYE